MPLFYCAIALAAVTVIYLFWRSYLSALLQRRRLLRERVTHLLWVLADAEEGPRMRKRSQQADSSSDLALG